MNNMKQQRLGQVFTNKFGTQFKIVVYTSATDLIVEFQDKYKARVHTNYKSCVTGSVRNPYDKTVCGVACLGVGYKTTQQDNKDSREYKLWKAMIERCYSNKETVYKNCTVCERWLCFSNFLQDLPKIQNYEYWYNNPGQAIALDKDIKGDSTLYSLETCCFVSQTTNSKERLTRKGNPTDKKPVKATHKISGEILIFTSITDAANTLGIQRAGIIACCNKRQKSAGGYEWEYYTK